MMFLLMLIGVTSTLKVEWQPVLSKPFVDGESQLALEETFDLGLVIRSASLQGWGMLRYSIFGETLPGAVPGKDGWLFTVEEYEAKQGFETRQEESIQKIIVAIEQLQSHGTKTIIALIPDKARIMAEQLHRPRAPLVEERYDAVLESLAGFGIDVVDLRPALDHAKEQGQVFLRTDTHWTPYGAQIVAAALSPHVRELTGTRTEFKTLRQKDVEYEGDLLAFIEIGPLAPYFGFTPEVVSTYVTTPVTSGDTTQGLFGYVSIPASLVGTSFSAITQWNFSGFLQQESQTDFLVQAAEGQGPFAPMDLLLAGIASGDATPQLVVWEIPERYLTILLKETTK